MNRIDESIVVSLQDRAEGPVQVEDLLGGARRRGKRRQVVRRTLTGVGVGAMALAVAGAVAILPLNAGGTGGPGGAPDTDGVGAATTGTPAEPGEPGRPPTVADSPALDKGGKPGGGLFHLDLAGPAADPAGLYWRSGQGWEQLSFPSGADSPGANGFRAAIGDSEAHVDTAQASFGDELHGAQAPQPVTFDGKPATFTSSGMNAIEARWGYLRWQPVPGVWAQVFSSFSPTGTNVDSDLAALMRAAKTLRFDRVYRCAVNFTIGWVPPGATVVGCSFAGGPKPGARSYLTLGDKKFSVFVASASTEKPVRADTEYAGVPMEYRESRVRRAIGDREVSVDQETDPLTRDDALHLTSSVEPVAAQNPADWPASPVR